MATASGRCRANHCLISSSTATRRFGVGSPDGVRMTPTWTRESLRPGTPSTTPTPHRVSPGSTARTRTAYLLGALAGSGRSEQVFGTTLTRLPREDGRRAGHRRASSSSHGPLRPVWSVLVVVELGEDVVGD